MGGARSHDQAALRGGDAKGPHRPPGGFGFLLADALGRPLLPHEEAMAVGQSGDNALRSLNIAALPLADRPQRSAWERFLESPP